MLLEVIVTDGCFKCFNKCLKTYRCLFPMFVSDSEELVVA